jgi:cation diffusion facilitator CzcD-associated flavoprotein CzcO
MIRRAVALRAHAGASTRLASTSTTSPSPPSSTSSSTSSSTPPAFAHVKRVAVIGGGVAGLQTARALRAYGFEPVVFEQAPEIGGVWRSNYTGFGLQVPKQLYEFPDFPFQVPEGYYPTGPEVQSYILAYADKFKLRPHIRTSTTVKSVAPRADGKRGWTVTTSPAAGPGVASDRVDVDFAVVCTGMYNKPSVPAMDGVASFKGRIIHSAEYTDKSVAKGKQVVVIGGGKSALDCASESAKAGAASTTLVQRSPHWGTPRKIAGLIPFQYVFLSRLGQALVSWYKGALPTAPGSVKAAHAALSVVMGPVFALVGELFAFQLGQKGPRRVKGTDVVRDFYGFAQVHDTTFKSMVASGKVKPVTGRVEKLEADAAVLTDGTRVLADVIVLGTGFTKSYDVFDASTRSKLGVQADGLYLYRNVLPPSVPDLAFVGSEVATISNITTHGLQAEWLARLLTGKVALPAPEAMEAAVRDHTSWARGWMPETSSRSNLVLLHQIHYHDRILKDMGVPHRRKGANVLAELFMPYQPRDYDGILKYE